MLYTGAPCVTQSDLGTENFNVAYAHTHIRHALDPTLAGTIQHQWKRGHTNVKPEQMWWRFRKMWAPGFENLLQKGIERQWYNNVNIGDRCVQLLYVRLLNQIDLNKIGWCFVGWPSLGYSKRLIHTFIITIRHPEGHPIGRYCLQGFRTSYSKTQKLSMLSISR